MEKIRYPSGSEVNFETFFDSIQTKAFANLIRRLQLFVQQFGLAVTVTNGTMSDELEVSLTNTNSTISVNTGSAITTSGEHLKIDTPQTTDNLAATNTNNGYGVVLTYKSIGSESKKSFNAFVFDKLGSGKSLNRNTVFSDGVGVGTQQITSDISTLKASLNEDQILIGAVYDSAGTFDPAAAGLNTYPSTTYGTFEVVDLREDEQMLLSSALLDDNVILFKDRPSTGANKFNQNIEFGQDLIISGTRKIVDGDGITYTLQSNQSNVELTSDNGWHYRLLQDGGVSKTRVSYLLSDDFRVNTGTELSPIWKEVLVAQNEDATDPSNLRLYDINPSGDPNEKYSLVSIRWNYDDITGSGTAGTNTFTLNETSYNGEDIDLNSDNPTGKKLYFSSSGNSYLITGVSYTAPNYTLTLANNLVSGDTTTQSNPARIIDNDIGMYRLIIKNSSNGHTMVETLDSTFIQNPKYTTKLPLGEQWSISLQAIDLAYEGTTVSMPAGSYDPDHASGGQTSISYGANFTNTLPDISTAGSVNMKADTQGFILKVGGWADSNDKNNTAHEYEVIYSSESDLSETHFNSLGSDGVERMVTQAGKAHISAGQPTTFSVAVRPLQNKQPVGDPIIKEVVSGGGGVAPNDAVLMSKEFEIKIVKGTVQAQSVDEFDIWWFDRNDQRFYPRAHFAEGRYFRELDEITGDPIDDADHFIEWHRDYQFNGTHRVYIPGAGANLSLGRDILSGISKIDRKIAEQSLDLDYRVTKMEVKTKAVSGATQQDPGIIRVYQKGFESSAATMEVPGNQEEPIGQKVDLPIKLASDGTRVLVADAFDPDTTSPNNDVDISGTLVVMGRPIVVNNLS